LANQTGGQRAVDSSAVTKTKNEKQVGIDFSVGWLLSCYYFAVIVGISEFLRIF